FGGPHVVGRGGVKVHLRAISVLEPAAALLLHGTGVIHAQSDMELAADPSNPDVSGPDPSASAPADVVLPAGGELLVVVAEQPGDPAPVAVAVGHASAAGAMLERLAVDESSRGLGIGRQVLTHWCFAAARRGAPLATAAASMSEAADGLLGATGFVRVGRTWCRELAR
ncbi:MAG: GNAT family N-acetyltransferase, partial [Microthrixaceae bacterium]